MGKTKKAEPDLKLWTLRPGGPTIWGATLKNKSLKKRLKKYVFVMKIPKTFDF